MQLNVLNDLAKAKRRWTEKKYSPVASGYPRLWWATRLWKYDRRVQATLFFEASYEEWSLAEDAKEAAKSDEPKREFFLPKGIGSVAKWGTASLRWDAYKKEKLTFAKAVTKSEHDEKMKKYLNFILAKFGEQACEEPTTQAVDLAMYLQARNYQPKKGYERTFAS